MSRVEFPSSLLNPRQASHGSRREQLFTILFVGGWTGITVAMSMYVFRMNKLAPTWADGGTMALLAFLIGILTKLLVGDMRTSFSSILLSTVVGALAMTVFIVSPYYILGIGTTTIMFIFGPLKDALMFLLVYQLPVQVAGYFTGFLIDGLRS
jgi:hypothetical protein